MRISEKTRTAAAGLKLNAMELCFYPLFYKKHADVTAQEWIRYGNGKRKMLDVYSKGGSAEKKPMFVYIHGGGWISGLRTARRYYCEHWAENGYVAVNIGYDYGSEIRHPSHLKDVFAGLTYVLDRADRFGIDASRVVVAGESAGAYIAAYVAAAASHREIYSKYGIDFPYADTFRVGACVLLSGVYSMTRVAGCRFPDIDLIAHAICGMDTEGILALKDAEREEKDGFFSPEYYADRDFPPAFVVGSAKDSLLGESTAFYEKLRSAGADAEFYLCKGINGVHAGALACDRGKSGRDCVKAAVRFVSEALRVGENVR